MSSLGPLVLFTDFGLAGPYVGQVKAAIHRVAPHAVVLDLCHDLAPFAPRPAAYLLAALLPYLPVGACVVAVVDPGVGTARRGLVLEGSGMRLIGPDNGLLAVAAQRLDQPCWHALPPPQEALSLSFQGRDWFAPAAARLQTGRELALQALGAHPPEGSDWPPDWACVIYIDRYGNAMTGLRADTLPVNSVLEVAGRRLVGGRTFADVPVGEAFWYANSCGLVEIAVNQGQAARMLDLEVGTPITVRSSRR
ncbi:MAG: SAM-dependent chlorinase/fluorinase [Candidatus Macondimonas sp.]